MNKLAVVALLALAACKPRLATDTPVMTNTPTSSLVLSQDNKVKYDASLSILSIDGHDYVVAAIAYKAISVVHSASCNCQNRLGVVTWPTSVGGAK